MTWEECLMKGMTNGEAARARGKTESAASQWARAHNRKFNRKRHKNKKDYNHLIHLTVAEAAEAAGITRGAITRWSQRNYVTFANTRWYDQDGV